MEGNGGKGKNEEQGSKEREANGRIKLDNVCEGTIWIRLQGDMAAKVISQPSKQTSRAVQQQHEQLSTHWARCTLPQLTLQLFLFKTSVAMSQSISLVWVLGWKAYDKQSRRSVTPALAECFWDCPTPSHMAGSSRLCFDDINMPIIIVMLAG